MCTEAKIDYEYYKKENAEFPKYELESKFEVTYNKNKFLSIPIRTYYYTGGAHGLTMQYGYNFDLKEAREVLIKDLFKHNIDYKAIINKEIREQIDLNKDEYYENIDFKSIEEDVGFYIDDNYLVIFYQQYEIAPYSSGIREFKVNLDKFNGNLIMFK